MPQGTCRAAPSIEQGSRLPRMQPTEQLTAGICTQACSCQTLHQLKKGAPPQSTSQKPPAYSVCPTGRLSRGLLACRHSEVPGCGTNRQKQACRTGLNHIGSGPLLSFNLPPPDGIQKSALPCCIFATLPAPSYLALFSWRPSTRQCTRLCRRTSWSLLPPAPPHPHSAQPDPDDHVSLKQTRSPA